VSAVASAVAGEGTIDQVIDDLAQLRLRGAETVVLEPSQRRPGDETLDPEAKWQMLAAVATTGTSTRERSLHDT
jgi:hypothetical protein